MQPSKNEAGAARGLEGAVTSPKSSISASDRQYVG